MYETFHLVSFLCKFSQIIMIIRMQHALDYSITRLLLRVNKKSFENQWIWKTDRLKIYSHSRTHSFSQLHFVSLAKFAGALVCVCVLFAQYCTEKFIVQVRGKIKKKIWWMKYNGKIVCMLMLGFFFFHLIFNLDDLLCPQETCFKLCEHCYCC